MGANIEGVSFSVAGRCARERVASRWTMAGARWCIDRPLLYQEAGASPRRGRVFPVCERKPTSRARGRVPRLKDSLGKPNRCRWLLLFRALIPGDSLGRFVLSAAGITLAEFSI